MFSSFRSWIIYEKTFFFCVLQVESSWFVNTQKLSVRIFNNYVRMPWRMVDSTSSSPQKFHNCREGEFITLLSQQKNVWIMWKMKKKTSRWWRCCFITAGYVGRKENVKMFAHFVSHSVCMMTLINMATQQRDNAKSSSLAVITLTNKTAEMLLNFHTQLNKLNELFAWLLAIFYLFHFGWILQICTHRKQINWKFICTKCEIKGKMPQETENWMKKVVVVLIYTGRRKNLIRLCEKFFFVKMRKSPKRHFIFVIKGEFLRLLEYFFGIKFFRNYFRTFYCFLNEFYLRMRH